MCTDFLFVWKLQEESLVEREDDLERRELENEESINSFRLERQKEALKMLVGRRRHEEREIVSAAFSKWVRVTMFDMEESGTKKGPNHDKELHEIRQKWQARELVLAALQEELELTRQELEEKTETNSQAESKLAKKITQLEKDRSALGKERLEIKDERERLNKDREAMATLDKFLHRRGQELDEREKSIKKGTDGGKTFSLYEQRSSKVLEDSQEEERKLMEETAAMLAQRETRLQEKETALTELEKELDAKKKEIEQATSEADEKQRRIHTLAQQLRCKEAEIGEKETSLSTEYEQYQGAHTRVQDMAKKLQKKEEQRSR